MPENQSRPLNRWLTLLSRLSVFVYDLLILGLIGIWIGGGLQFQSQLYLRHGADPRRAAILLGILGYSLFPFVRRKSFVLRGVLILGRLLTRSSVRWAVLTLCTVAACFIAEFQTKAVRVTLYDVGIFHQILWSLAHGLGFNSTISGAGDFLLDHFSPSLILLVPIFKFFKESPVFLPIAQAVLLFGGGAAWVFLAARVPGVAKEFRMKLAAATTVFVVSFDSLWGNLKWGFHENVIGFFCMSWGLAFLFSQSWDSSKLSRFLRQVAAFCLFLIAAGSKEILLLDVGLAFLCWAITEGFGWSKERAGRLNAFFTICLVATALVLFWQFYRFETMPHPADKNYFDRYYGYLGHNLSEFFHTLSLHPWRVVETIGGQELLRYLGRVLLPFGFLPLFLSALVVLRRRNAARTVSQIGFSPWILAIMPSFASAALASYAPLRNSNFHYVLELWPLLASLTILCLSVTRSIYLIWIWALFSLLRLDHDPVADYREFVVESKKTGEIRAKMEKIPAEFAVVADDLAGPWIAGRRFVTRWPETTLLPQQCPDFILVRNSESGTLTERGVRTIMSRCESHRTEPKFNADLMAPSPLWRSGIWAGYQVKKKK